MEKLSTRTKEKIKNLKTWVKQLEKITPKTYKNYKSDFIISSACERITEKIIEEMIIISNLILKEKGITKKEKPFEILKDLDILSNKLSERLEKIKGMRNLMVHSYDSFDEEIFYLNLKNLINDSKQYIKELENNPNI